MKQLSPTPAARQICKWLTGSAVVGAGIYSACAAVTWLRYGKHRSLSDAGEIDSLLDAFIPVYEVSERHQTHVAAPADIAFQAALCCDPAQSLLARSVFRTREIVLGSRPVKTPGSSALLAQMKTVGWKVLAEVPGRELVMGAVTKPWEADVLFRGIAPDEFRSFDKPGFAKIVWTIRADPVGSAQATVRTETRVVTTDQEARSRFRRYWAFVSPGVVLIRYAILHLVKRDAERCFCSRSC